MSQLRGGCKANRQKCQYDFKICRYENQTECLTVHNTSSNCALKKATGQCACCFFFRLIWRKVGILTYKSYLISLYNVDLNYITGVSDVKNEFTKNKAVKVKQTIFTAFINILPHSNDCIVSPALSFTIS